jgi:hypothetical protein
VKRLVACRSGRRHRQREGGRDRDRDRDRDMATRSSGRHKAWPGADTTGAVTAMCFSPEASFVGGGAVTALGVAALSQVRDRRQVALAALPLAFGLHQLTEGVVWLSVREQVSSAVGTAAVHAYLLYAQVLLPMLLPLSVLLLERVPWRRWALAGLLLAGAGVAAVLLHALLVGEIDVQVSGSSLDYGIDAPYAGQLAVVYVLATCGPLLLSATRWLVVLGVLNLGAVALTLAVQAATFTSVWCAYAAWISGAILLFLQRHRNAPRRLRFPRSA